jgi:predicted translin family RNA/ssDNA-binding protein
MDSPTDRLLTDFVMMVGLLRRDMKQKNDFERYEGRFSRIEQKFAALAEEISRHNPDLAKALHTAFQQPARALAFKNAEHQKQLKDDKPGGGKGNPEDN